MGHIVEKLNAALGDSPGEGCVVDYSSMVLGLLIQAPSGVVGLILTWWTHERFIRKRGREAASMAGVGEIPPGRKGHSSRFIPSYLLLFLGYSNLLAVTQFVILITLNQPVLSSYLGVLPFAGLGALLTIGGFHVLRMRSRSSRVVGGI